MGNRHHFVPRFYLQSFASAPKRIHIYNVARRLPVFDASLRDQCYAHRLYGADGVVEDGLAKIEGVASQVLAEVIQNKAVPRQSSEQHAIVLVFLSLQLNRTLAAASIAQRISSAMGNAAFGESPPREFKPNMEEALAMSMSAAPKMAESLRDLKMVLVETSVTQPFVTSDNPVFRYNMYGEGITHLGATGTALSGFQLFFPLTPTLLLFLSDGHVYKVGSRRMPSIVTATDADVLALNRLQGMSAEANLYFSDSLIATHLAPMLDGLSRHRAKNRPHINIAVDREDSRSHLIHQYWPMPQLGVRLSFVTVQKHARRIALMDRAGSVRKAHQKQTGAGDDELGRLRTFEVTSRR